MQECAKSLTLEGLGMLAFYRLKVGFSRPVTNAKFQFPKITAEKSEQENRPMLSPCYKVHDIWQQHC